MCRPPGMLAAMPCAWGLIGGMVHARRSNYMYSSAVRMETKTVLELRAMHGTPREAAAFEELCRRAELTEATYVCSPLCSHACSHAPCSHARMLVLV